jgi:hypothetical protein
MPAPIDTYREQLTDIRELIKNPTLPIEERRRLVQSIGQMKSNLRQSRELESQGVGVGDIVKKAAGTGMDAVGGLLKAVDYPDRELIRRPIITRLEKLGLPGKTSESEYASFVDVGREAGLPEWAALGAGVAGDVATGAFSWALTPLKFTKLATKFGHIGGVPLSKAGGKYATELTKNLVKHGVEKFKAPAIAREQMLKMFEEGTLARKFLDEGGTKIGVPFTDMERSLVTMDQYRTGAAKVREIAERSEIGRHIYRIMDGYVKPVMQKLRMPVNGPEEYALQLSREQGVAIGQKAAADLVADAVEPIYKTGWMKRKQNKATLGAARTALERLRNFEAAEDVGAFATEWGVAGQSKMFGKLKGLTNPDDIAQFFDENASDILSWKPFKDAIAGTDAAPKDMLESMKRMQMLTAGNYQRVVQEFGEDAVPRFWEAYMPLVFKPGFMARIRQPEAYSGIRELMEQPLKSGREFATGEDALNYIRTVAQERGLKNVADILTVETDPIKLITAHLMAGETAIQNKRLADGFVELAKRRTVTGRGALQGLKVTAKADNPDPYMGLVKMGKEPDPEQLENLLNAGIPDNQAMAILRKKGDNGMVDPVRDEYLGGREGWIETQLMPEGLDKVKLGEDWHIGPVKQVEALKNLAAFDTSGKFRSEVAGWFMTMTNNFKRLVTQPWLSFHIRNLYSDMGRQMEDHAIASLSPARQMQAFQIMRGAEGTYKSPVLGDIPFSDIRDIFKHHLMGFHSGRGDYAKSFMTEMRAKSGDTRHMLSKYTNFMENFGVGVENHSKMIGFLNGLDSGLTVEESVARTYRMHFNYGWMTRAWKEGKAFVPFLAWQKNAFQHLVTQMLEHPVSQVNILRGMKTAERQLPRVFGAEPLTDDQRGALPEYLQESIPIPLWNDALVSGDAGILSGFDIVQGEWSMLSLLGADSFDDAQRQIGKIAAVMNPLIKIPAELMAKEDFFFGTPIGDISRVTSTGHTRYPFIDKEVPFGLEALKDPVRRKFIEAAGVMVSIFPGMTWGAAIGRLISEQKRLARLYKSSTEGNVPDIISQVMNIGAGFRVRPVNLPQQQVRQLTGDIDAQNKLLRQAAFQNRPDTE